MAQKRNIIQDILLDTNASVEMSQQDTDKETEFTMLHGKANSMGLIAETIECPGWIHKLLIEKNGSNLQELIEDFEKVHVEFSGDNKIIVEGPTNMIPKVIESLKKAVDNYVSTELVVQPKCCKYLIGKNGKNINCVKNDTGVLINISKFENNSNVIHIKGRKDGVELAKSKLEEMIYRFENKVEKEISIDQRHHSAIIGFEHKKLKELQKAFNVEITFPSQASKVKVESNLIKICGLNDDVNEAFLFLTKMAKELDENNFVLENISVGKDGTDIKKKNIIQIVVNVDRKYHCDIFARRDKIKMIKGVSIKFPKIRCNDHAFIIKGNESDAQEAKHKIEDIINDLENVVEINMEIPKHHQHFVVPDFLTQINEKYNKVYITVRFPLINSNSSNVLIRGYKDDVEIVKNNINYNLKQCIGVEVIIPQRTHKVLMRNQDLFKGMRQDLSVWFKFPNCLPEEQYNCTPYHVNVKEDTNENCASSVNDIDIVTIFGKPENCNNAKQILIDNIPTVIEMTIERELHEMIIGHKGDTVRKLRNKYGVQVNLPTGGEGDNENILTIIGYQQSAESVRDEIKKKVDILKNKKEIYIDSRIHRRLIGIRGTNITQIMNKYHVDIFVSKADSSNPDLITIHARENATQDDVLNCMDYLDTIQHYYLAELLEHEDTKQTR